MSLRLTPVLSRWEIDPPTIYAHEACHELNSVFGALRDQSILRQTTPTGWMDCTECGQRRKVRYIADASGEMQGFICCSDCGVTSVPPLALARWEIDTIAFLSAVFAGVNLSVQQRVAGHLWQVGKANWAGRWRDVWFVRAYRRDDVVVAVKELSRRPKAIVFAPTEAGAGRWQEAIGNLVIALESSISFDGDAIILDVGYIESRIVDAGMGGDATPKRRPKKRASRAANIELLKKEVILHLRAAEDHAFAKKDQTGEPELLPRPTQKALGERVGLSESDVSRCMKDPDARELQLYWTTALDLDQIMSWKGPITKGRKS